MTRACQCGGIIRQHQLTGEREAWTCNACGRYGAIAREAPVHIDIERMERALAGPRWTVPSGLSDQELHQYILDVAAGKIEPDAAGSPAVTPTT